MVAERAFAHTLTCPRTALPVAWVDGLYRLDRARAGHECPYVVAQQVIPWDGTVPASDEATDGTERVLLDRAAEAAALLVDDVAGLVRAVPGGRRHGGNGLRGVRRRHPSRPRQADLPVGDAGGRPGAQLAGAARTVRRPLGRADLRGVGHRHTERATDHLGAGTGW